MDDEGAAPWLICSSHDHEDANQTFYSINHNIKTTTPESYVTQLNNKSIVASTMGWLVLRECENTTMYSLWNPITGQSIILPELLDPPEGTLPETCIFTSPPNNAANANCVFLLFFQGLVYSCMLSDGRWVKQSLEHEGNTVTITSAVAAVDGDIYACAAIQGDQEEDGSFCIVFARLRVGNDNNNNNNSVVFEALSLPGLTEITAYRMLHRPRSYLVEVSGVLYGVHVIPRQLVRMDADDLVKVLVWKLDSSKEKWVQVESLGDRALLLGRNCCTWCWADASQGRIEGNCIYMTSIQSSDYVLQYRLQDSSYTFLSSHSSFRSCSDGPFWFMPHNPTRLKTSLVDEADKIVVESTKHVEDSEEIPAALLIKLPSEILISVANRLHWFDCMNLRASCRILRSEIPRPQWKANASLPLFMFLSNTEGKCELWDPCYQNNNGCRIIKKLPYSPSIISTIEFCKDGWLLLRSHEGCYLQYMNLLTGERGEYPTEDLPPGLSNILFSTWPTSPDCITLGVCGLGFVTCGLIKSGEKEWSWFVNDIVDVDFQSNYNMSPKYYNGSFYFLGHNGNLGVFKMTEAGECSWVVHKGPLEEEVKEEEDPFSNLNECYIAELDGQLICVFIQDVGSKVEVHRFDIEQKLWEEVKCLGDYMLFVSSASSFSVPAATDSSMRNRIYLPKRIGNEMVFYSLDTRKYHTSSNVDSFLSFHGMTSQPFSCWV